MGKYVISFGDFDNTVVNEAGETGIRKTIIDAASKLDKVQQAYVQEFLKVAKDSDLEKMAANLANGAKTVHLEAAGESTDIDVSLIADEIVKESASWNSDEEINEGFKELITKIGKIGMYILGSISLAGGIISGGSMFLQSKMAIFDVPVSGLTGALAVYGGIVVAGLLFSGAASLEKD